MQSQKAILKLPKRHTLVQIYEFENLPLIAMNLVRIGAQTPSMVCELEAENFPDHSKIDNKESKINTMVGFGPMAWILITPDPPVRCGFRSFDETEIDGFEVPATFGDMFFYFSSEKEELNRILADKIKELFGPNGNLLEELAMEGGTFSDIAGVQDKVFVDRSENLDTMGSSFVLTQKFKSDTGATGNLPRHSFPWRMGSCSGEYAITFSNDPKKLEAQAGAVLHPPVSRGLFFIPSLDLLTSLRMGGIRMGSLAINAKWKE